MAPFTQDTLDWRRIDVTALITHNGIATISPEHRDACIRWLEHERYDIRSVDCSRAFRDVLQQIGDLFRWKEEFGYALQDGEGKLDAIRDGFDFDIPDGRGVVLVLTGVDSLWNSQRKWTGGLLSIASEHSRYQLALGRRFFTLLVLADTSPVTGTTYDELTVPMSTWDARYDPPGAKQGAA